MKIIGEEEKEAHRQHVLAEGTRGMFYGACFSVGLYTFFKKRRPATFRSFSPSVKACVLTMPTVSLCALFADKGSVEFDHKMHQSEGSQRQLLEEFREWKEMSMADQLFTGLNAHKYKIIFASWGASMYGSWVLVNRDKVMTTAQKAVQARMYAQAVTILLLLGTILLAMKEEQLARSRPPPVPEWKRIVMEREEQCK